MKREVITTAAGNGTVQSAVFDGPTLVRQAEARRFLWGDVSSGQVSDLIYGRGERISGVTFSLGPGHWFGASEAWKPLYDQHRVYYVVQGTLVIRDPESGEVAIANAGEAVTWRGARYHFGYNFGDDELVVLDWFAPKERPLDVSEITAMQGKRNLSALMGGCYDLLGRWPDAAPEEHRRLHAEGSPRTVRPDEALHVVVGETTPMLVSILSSSSELTVGTFDLRGGARSETESHPGDEVLFVLSGRLHVHLPEDEMWFEVHPLDCLYLPEGTPHQYWTYGGQRSRAAFCVAPQYR